MTARSILTSLLALLLLCGCGKGPRGPMAPGLPKPAATPNEVGNGGHPLAGEIAARAHFIYQRLRHRSDTKDLLGSEEWDRFRGAINDTRIEPVHDEVRDVFDSVVGCAVVDDPLHPGRKMIRVSIRAWEYYRNKASLDRLVFHEYLRVIGVNDENFRISRRAVITLSDFLLQSADRPRSSSPLDAGRMVIITRCGKLEGGTEICAGQIGQDVVKSRFYLFVTPPPESGVPGAVVPMTRSVPSETFTQIYEGSVAEDIDGTIVETRYQLTFFPLLREKNSFLRINDNPGPAFSMKLTAMPAGGTAMPLPLDRAGSLMLSIRPPRVSANGAQFPLVPLQGGLLPGLGSLK